MVTWIIPPLGFVISAIGLILGVLERLIQKNQKGRAITGIILSLVGIFLGIGVIVGLLTAGLIIDEWLMQNSFY